MNDLKILEKLYKGLPLKDNNLERACYILEMLNKEIKRRLLNKNIDQFKRILKEGRKMI